MIKKKEIQKKYLAQKKQLKKKPELAGVSFTNPPS
jgi:hypothetical protein